MNIICLDFESFFSDEYTLSKSSTEAYIRDPRFEAHGCAIKHGRNLTPYWVNGSDLPRAFAEIDWTNTGVIAHHSNFDGLILSHHYEIKPKFWFCTLSMARLLIGNHLSVGLDSLARHFGLAAKTVPYNLFKNKHWHELSVPVQNQVAAGCIHDVELTWQLFEILGKQFPSEEYEVVDTTVKMFTDPVLRADVQMLADIWTSEATRKAERTAALGVSEADLQSADRFAQMLRDEGIEPETKDGKNGDIYAFAKTDQFMRDLLEDDNERVQALAEARLGVKSTIMQTRAETLGFMSQRGPMPVYLRYAGAGTLRVSGGDGANWLNFKRSSLIRKAIMAPEGYLLAPVDSSQIEFRVCMYLAGQENVLQQLRNNEDPYVDTASEFYCEQIYKPAKDDPRRLEMEQKRGVGKQAKLMCQYGAAGPKFQAAAKAGLYGPPLDMTAEEAKRFVELYRAMHPAVCAKHHGYWAQAERMIARLAGGPPVQWGPLEVRDHKIFLPNGCMMHYDTLEFYVPGPDEDVREFERSGYWRVRTRQGWKKLWGSKLTQNICEAVSRVIVSQAMIRITRMSYRVLNWPYDELLILIPKDGREEQHLQLCMAEMKRSPAWLPEIPLDCEGSLGERYSK